MPGAGKRRRSVVGPRGVLPRVTLRLERQVVRDLEQLAALAPYLSATPSDARSREATLGQRDHERDLRKQAQIQRPWIAQAVRFVRARDDEARALIDLVERGRSLGELTDFVATKGLTADLAAAIRDWQFTSVCAGTTPAERSVSKKALAAVARGLTAVGSGQGGDPESGLSAGDVTIYEGLLQYARGERGGKGLVGLMPDRLMDRALKLDKKHEDAGVPPHERAIRLLALRTGRPSSSLRRRLLPRARARRENT